MSAEAWEREQDAHNLLRLLPVDFSRRKLRWFVIAVVRDEIKPSVGSESARILAFAERIADYLQSVDADEWTALQVKVIEERCAESDYAEGNAGYLEHTVAYDVWEETLWLIDHKSDSERGRAGALLREVFGNPFRPLDFAPWRTDTAVALARTMYESRDFGAMPILADALQDAGCDSAEVLTHCRDAAQVHVRGCWVVDGVLGLS
jgi:hypothetical protein